MISQKKDLGYILILTLYSILQVFQINQPSLYRYPNWDSFWGDTYTYGNLVTLKKALMNFELLSISPYTNFVANLTGDTTLTISFLNPINWLILLFPFQTVIQVRMIFFFLIAVLGVFFLIREITENRSLAFFLSLLYISLPVNISLFYDSNMLVFAYFTPGFLYIIHKVYSTLSLKWVLGFILYSILAASSGEVHILLTLPIVIGLYAFIIGFGYFHYSVRKAFVISLGLTMLWGAGSACYIIPLLDNIRINGIAMNELANADIYHSSGLSLSFIFQFFLTLFPGLFTPVDAGYVYYVPFSCYIILITSFIFRKKIFPENRNLFIVVLALLIVSLALFLESFIFYLIPILAKKATGLLRVQTMLFPYFIILSTSLCIYAGVISRIKHKMNSDESQNQFFYYIFIFIIFFPFIIDVSLFIIPSRFLEKLFSPAFLNIFGYSAYRVNHGIAQVNSSNLISVKFLNDMWPILPFVNIGIIGSIVMVSWFSVVSKIVRKDLYLGIFSMIIAFFSLALHNELRTQQGGWGLQANSPYRWETYKERKQCIDNLINRTSPNFRTLYTGIDNYRANRVRNWKLIAETELNPIDGEKVLFSYRNTTHPYNGLLLSSFYRCNSFYSQNFFPPSATAVNKSIDLVRLMGVKWVISADQTIENKSLIYRGTCTTSKSGPFPYNISNAEVLHEKGSLYIYELSNPPGVSFLIDHYKVLTNKEILRSLYRQGAVPWTKNIVYLEEKAGINNGEEKSIPIQEGGQDNASVQIVKETLNKITLHTKSNREKFLVLTYVFLPKWSAYVDNAPAKIFRAYGVFMSITIPSGEHTVEFIYTPWDVYLGLIISFGIVVLVLIIMFLSNGNRFSRKV